MVAKAFVAQTNERNEYGKAHLERTHPFTSSSSDVLQAALECNADYQYQDRAVPDCDDEDEPVHQQQLAGHQNILYGYGTSSPVKLAFMNAQKAGMKAAYVCDFYMTKYRAKAQQILSSALGPLLQGLRRYEAEEAELEELPLVREEGTEEVASHDVRCE